VNCEKLVDCTTNEESRSGRQCELLGLPNPRLLLQAHPVPESTLGIMARSMRCILEDPTSGSRSDGSVFGPEKGIPISVDVSGNLMAVHGLTGHLPEATHHGGCQVNPSERYSPAW